MRKRFRILIAILLVAVVGGIALELLQPREPSYQRKRWSDWLKDYHIEDGLYGPQPKADEAMRHMGTNVIPFLLQRLRANDSKAKTWLMGLEARQSVIRLHLSHAEDDYWKVEQAFKALGPLGKPAVPELIELAHGPHGIGFELVGDYAGGALTGIGAESISAIKGLLADKSSIARARAAISLGQMGGVAEPALTNLMEGLKDIDAYVRLQAARALGAIGKQPMLVVPALVESLKDPSSGVRSAAVISLGAFGDEAATTALLTALADPDDKVRAAALSTLKSIAPELAAKQTVRTRIRDLKDPSPYVRFMAAYYLGVLHQEPDIAVPALIDALNDVNVDVRRHAAHALGKFGPVAKAAVPKLLSMAQDQEMGMRNDVIHSLKDIDPEATDQAGVK
ncbi:MAG: putative lyase [Pedosphaera sp.]|jgi:HEAT repeat protein|nr:putative lyase [Pedosphaera sp.]